MTSFLTMFAAFTKENFYNFLFIACLALVILVILWIFLHFYYKKRKLVARLNEEHKIEVLEEPTFVSDEVDTLSSKYDNVVEETKLEEVVEEPNKVEEEKVEIVETVSEVDEFNNSKVVSLVRYRKSFVANLILKPNLQDLYKEIKNKFLSYKKVHARLSFKNERFSLGRKTLAKLLVRGKKLYLYLALDPNTLEDKYHVLDVSDKKSLEQTPSLLRVLSPRSLKYALDLIEKLMLDNETEVLPLEKVVPTDYDSLLENRSFEQLIKEKLIIEYNVNQVVSKDFDESTLNLSDEDEGITEAEADVIVDDEELNDSVRIVNKNRSGKMDIVNIDTLSINFKANDIIDLESLKIKGLISKKAKRVKVLARGKINKALDIEADSFSKGAMKMILAKGGNVTLIK